MGFTRGTRYTLLYAGHGGDVVQVAKIMLETFVLLSTALISLREMLKSSNVSFSPLCSVSLLQRLSKVQQRGVSVDGMYPVE